MASRRPPITFPELEARGRHAILRTSEEVQAEEALLAADNEESLAEQPVRPVANEAPASPPESEPPSSTSQKERKNARKQERIHEREKEDTQPQRPFAADLLFAIIDSLNAPATMPNSFRYTESELSDLADVVYEVNKRHRVKVSKQDVLRLGLEAIIRDYQDHGDASLLGQFAATRRQRRVDS